MDPAIFPCLDGNRTPLDYRVDPAVAVKADFDDPDRARLWQEYYKKTKSISSEELLLFSCGAGLTNFHIDPSGTLLPCMMLSKPSFDLLTGNFLDGWQNEINKLRSIKAPDDHKCSNCSKRGICGYCPAYFKIKSESLKTHSQYFCELGESRLKAINSLPVE